MDWAAGPEKRVSSCMPTLARVCLDPVSGRQTGGSTSWSANGPRAVSEGPHVFARVGHSWWLVLGICSITKSDLLTPRFEHPQGCQKDACRHVATPRQMRPRMNLEGLLARTKGLSLGRGTLQYQPGVDEFQMVVGFSKAPVHGPAP